MEVFDLQTPFFLPLRRRIAAIVLSLGWAGMEISHEAFYWAACFGAAGLWMVYQFFVIWDEDYVRAIAKEKEDD
ncbi:MAG: hypothetical protein JKX69_06095 [Rhodobacteraceae bacterium]|nr:hypothetical protein [Paracoccaceae bacterium]